MRTFTLLRAWSGVKERRDGFPKMGDIDFPSQGGGKSGTFNSEINSVRSVSEKRTWFKRDPLAGNDNVEGMQGEPGRFKFKRKEPS